MLTARIEAHIPERRELVQALLEWATAARRDAGSVGSGVYEDLELPAAFCLISRWESREALEAHLRGSTFGVVLGALELLARPPQVSIAQLADENGTEALRTIRRLRDRVRGIAEPKPTTEH